MIWDWSAAKAAHPEAKPEDLRDLVGMPSEGAAEQKKAVWDRLYHPKKSSGGVASAIVGMGGDGETKKKSLDLPLVRQAHSDFLAIEPLIKEAAAIAGCWENGVSHPEAYGL